MGELAQFSRLKAELATATKIDEVKGIRDKAEALRAYCRQAKEGLPMQNKLAEIVIRAERRAGEMLRDGDKAKGGQPYQKKSTPCTMQGVETLADLGIEYTQSHRWQKMAEMPEDVFEEHIREVQADVKGELTTAGVLKLAKELDKDEAAEKRAADKAAQVAKSPAKPIIHMADGLTFNPGEPVDLLLTDPPYSTDIADIEAFAPQVVSLVRFVKPTGRAYICIGSYPRELRAYLNAPVPAGFKLDQVLVWTYRNIIGPAPKRLYKTNWQAILYFVGADAPDLDCPELNELFSVSDISAPDGRHDGRLHAWQKPDALAERFIRHSTTQGQVVFDPFAGTGTFVLQAALLGRQGIGCENDQGMLDIAVGRGCIRGDV